MPNPARRLLHLIFATFILSQPPLIHAQTPDATSSIPHFQTINHATQLILNNLPFLILGGELGNSTPSGPESLQTIWPTIKALHVNTIIAPVYWERSEPTEGQFDFTLADTLLHQARDNGVHVIVLWFGVWKNSMSTYVPTWVKQNTDRFPRAEDHAGNKLEILSPFSDETLQADRKAFAALMRHLREIDSTDHTILMVQVENEIGMLPDASDYSPAAKAAMAQPVPKELLDCLSQSNFPNSAAAALWKKHGSPATGNWTDIFGSDPAGGEVFIAWHYAKFIDALVQAGKAEYPLPMYVNCALNRPGRLPGQYPSGGPLPHLLDVWETAAPHLDMLSPDIYFFNFADWLEKYRQSGRPIFVPESMRTARAPANAFFTIGNMNAIGFSPFDIELIPDPSHNLLGQAYGLLGQLAREILAAQRDGKIYCLAPRVGADSLMDFSEQTIQIDGYTLHVTFDGTGPTIPITQAIGDPSTRGANLPPSGALLYVTAPGEYTVIGTGVKIEHTADNAHVGFLDVDEWTNRDGNWSHYRWLNGDETNQGRDIHLYPGDLKMQRVRLYKY